MVSSRELPLAARRYLEELELCLKRRMGVSPEQALSDAREYLLLAADELAQSGVDISDEKLGAHFRSSFGEPEAVAEQYAAVQPANPLIWPSRLRAHGYAPGWRICCTRCGRSAPLAAIGGIRIGARSVHKYTIGWCRECRWFRFLRIIRDLDAANLTQRMGVTKTPEESLRSMHRPVLTIVLILFMTFAIIAGVWAITAAVAPR